MSTGSASSTPSVYAMHESECCQGFRYWIVHSMLIMPADFSARMAANVSAPTMSEVKSGLFFSSFILFPIKLILWLIYFLILA